MFLNLKDGILTINSYRFPDAEVTTAEDLLRAYYSGSSEILTAINPERRRV